MSNETADKSNSRGKYQKELSLKAGKHIDFGQVKKCRKIFIRIDRGTVRFEITGDYFSDLVCQAGYTGGPLSGGGGDFTPGTINIRVWAPVDTDFYLHIEWNEGSIFEIFG
jgi:hypothetical protein